MLENLFDPLMAMKNADDVNDAKEFAQNLRERLYQAKSAAMDDWDGYAYRQFMESVDHLIQKTDSLIDELDDIARAIYSIANTL